MVYPCQRRDPVSKSKFMGRQLAQVPLRLTPEYIESSIKLMEHVYKNTGYQGEQMYKAAQKWIYAAKNGGFIWFSQSGAASPVGLDGILADMITLGLVDVVVTTGANAYHDLHFACGLPVRHGSATVDDNKLWDDRTTRIYTQFIHNTYTLKGQDAINQYYGRRMFESLKPPFSSATLLNQFGKRMLEDQKFVVDTKGSFVLRAAEYEVPIFLDSTSNHSLAMDFAPLKFEGYDVSVDSDRDILESAAISFACQPQVNVFLGEGGPRNFTQTTAPTAAEILFVDFKGSDSSIKFTTADVRNGALSGSTQAEAKSWGKYVKADPSREIEVWSEYTISFPVVAAYVAGHVRRSPSRLMLEKDEIFAGLVEKFRKREDYRAGYQERLRRQIERHVTPAEVDVRKAAGYRFGYDITQDPDFIALLERHSKGGHGETRKRKIKK